jgi:hypothetical protein
MNQQYLVLAGTAIGGLAIGAGITYLVTNKRIEAKYAQIAQDEIADAKAYYRVLHKKDDLADPVELVDKYKSLVVTARYADRVVESDIADDIPETEDEPVVEDDGFDYEEEIRNRTPDRPYIISHAEYFEDKDDYPQVTFTYFEEDDILVDEGESPIHDTESVVGDVNLTQFGHGSRDNNIVYIRNDVLELEFEIVRNKGNYAKEVLGYIEHSESRGRPGKFRRDDE